MMKNLAACTKKNYNRNSDWQNAGFLGGTYEK